MRRAKEDGKPHHPLCSLPTAEPWKSSVHLVTVFTQPAGHTLPLAPQSCRDGPRSPGLLRPPHPGGGAPALRRLQHPLGYQKTGASGNSPAQVQNLPRLSLGVKLGRRALEAVCSTKKGNGNQEGRRDRLSRSLGCA